MAKGLVARKLGMTQVFNPDGTVAAVTVLEAGPCRVLGLRTPERDGYQAARLAFGRVEPRRLSKPRLGEFRKAGQEPTCEIFSEGELVDVTGTSKGKGFQGMVKRHGFGRGPETHGSMNVRKPGSIGATDAARVFKGLRMAGHMGHVRATVQGLRVLRVDPQRNLLLVHGSVPGPRGGMVVVRGSIKQRARKKG